MGFFYPDYPVIKQSPNPETVYCNYFVFILSSVLL